MSNDSVSTKYVQQITFVYSEMKSEVIDVVELSFLACR